MAGEKQPGNVNAREYYVRMKFLERRYVRQSVSDIQKSAPEVIRRIPTKPSQNGQEKGQSNP